MLEANQVGAGTLAQLQVLQPSMRPLVVCDVDEVILHLVAPFEDLLGENGMELRKKAVRLTGNVFHLETGEEVSQPEIWSVLETLFEEQAKRQHPVENVADVLADIHRSFDLVLLTNLPGKYGDLRRDYLAKLGMPYPLATNEGPKGPALRWLKQRWDMPMLFIDDTPQHLENAREFVPDIHLIHFMANGEFRDMIGDLETVLLSTGNWSEVGQIIQETLGGKGHG